MRILGGAGHRRPPSGRSNRRIVAEPRDFATASRSKLRELLTKTEQPSEWNSRQKYCNERRGFRIGEGAAPRQQIFPHDIVVFAVAPYSHTHVRLFDFLPSMAITDHGWADAQVFSKYGRQQLDGTLNVRFRLTAQAQTGRNGFECDGVFSRGQKFESARGKSMLARFGPVRTNALENVSGFHVRCCTARIAPGPLEISSA